MRRLLLSCALLAVLAAPAARANGDPASDVLYFQDVYLPYTKPSAERAQELNDTVRDANRAGYRIKVAVIETAQDLGAVPSLFGKPGLYARFLGTEIRTFYTKNLLVVMPQGFGFYADGVATDKEEKLLAGMTVDAQDSDGLTAAATAAVKALHAAAGSKAGADRIAPKVKVYPASVRRGTVGTLRYAVSDNSGRTREILRVYGANYLLYATLARPFAAAKPGTVRVVKWRVPKSLKAGTLKLCVLAIDPAGNEAPSSCAALKVA
jgi:hypothetical protein